MKKGKVKPCLTKFELVRGREGIVDCKGLYVLQGGIVKGGLRRSAEL